MLDHSANPGRHPLKDRAMDLYETPRQAVMALLRAEKLPHSIWEPACGPGAIVSVLRGAGHWVWATDLVHYNIGPQDLSGVDFLMEYRRRPGIEAIVTNPPYRLAQEFVEKALTLVPKVVMLMRLAFLESEKRSPILDSGLLAKVYVFRNRLPMLHRDGWTGPRASSSIPFCWMIWDESHKGPTELHRISWKAA